MRHCISDLCQQPRSKTTILLSVHVHAYVSLTCLSGTMRGINKQAILAFSDPPSQIVTPALQNALHTVNQSIPSLSATEPLMAVYRHLKPQSQNVVSASPAQHWNFHCGKFWPVHYAPAAVFFFVFAFHPFPLLQMHSWIYN